MKAIQPTAIRPIVVFLAGLIAIVISGGALVGWAYENETLKRLSLQFVVTGPHWVVRCEC